MEEKKEDVKENEVKTVSEEAKTESTAKETVKVKTGKEKNPAVIVVIIALVLLLIAGGVVAGIVITKNNEDEGTSKKKKLSWGETYLEILEDNDGKLNEIEGDTKIQLVDIDKDNIPELIVYGLNSAKEHIANIYKINDKEEVDTIKLQLADEFDLRLLYTYNDDDYNWYAVTNINVPVADATNTATTNNVAPEKEKAIYNLNIISKTYNPEKLALNFETDVIEVENGYSQKIAFNKGASKDEKKKSLDEATEKYVETEEMITEEVKSKVEAMKIFHDVKKLDNTKDIVYTGLSYKSQYVSLEYPIINIDSEDVKAINAEIYKKYGFTQEEKNKGYNSYGEPIGGLETEEISYDFNVYKTYLSVVVRLGGNSSVWVDTYCIDLKTLKKMSTDEILAVGNLTKDSALSKAKELGQKAFNETIQKDKAAWGTHWEQMYGSKAESDWQTKLNDEVTKMEKLYINVDGTISQFVTVQHPGGQWSCSKCIRINLNNSNYAEEKLKNGMSSDSDWSVMLKDMNEEPKPSTSPSTKPSTAPSQATQSSSSSGPTNPAITKDQALELAKKKYGTKVDAEDMSYDISYSYAGWGKYNGKEYYVFIMRQNVVDHWTYINTACISTDGKSWASIASNNSDFNGETLDVDPAYAGAL